MRLMNGFLFYGLLAALPSFAFTGPIRVDVGGLVPQTILLTDVPKKGKAKPTVVFFFDGSVYRQRTMANAMDKRIRDELRETVAEFPPSRAALGCQREIRVSSKRGTKTESKAACWDTLKADAKLMWEAWYGAVAQLR